MKAVRIISLTPLIFLALLIVIGCGPDPEQMKNDAQGALAAGDFTHAQELASQALERVPGTDKRLQWALERIRLEALARGNRGAEARDSLERLSGAYPTQVKASLYLAMATYLRDAGGVGDAIEILIAGDERFPEESAKFKAMIQEIEAGGLMDPAEVERLRSIGYL